MAAHGGTRPGAGRKPNPERKIKRSIVLSPAADARVLASMHEGENFSQTLERLVLSAMPTIPTIAAPQLSQEARALMAALTPERQPVATVYRRLSWSRQMLEQTISQHRAELERAGLRLHVATHGEASGRLDRYITVDGTRYSTLSRG